MLIDLKMAQEIVDWFGGDEETEASIDFFTKAHAERGYYISAKDYPEDGCSRIGITETDELISNTTSHSKEPKDA